MKRGAGELGPLALCAIASLIATPLAGCAQILGIHDLPEQDDGGSADSGGSASSGGSSGTSSGKLGSSTSSGSGSGASSSSGGSSSGIRPPGSSSSSSSGSASGSSSSGSASGSGGSGSASGSSGSASSSGGSVVVTPIMGAACMISGDAHWKLGVYVIQCDLVVNATLTLDPGVILKFGLGHSMKVGSTGTVSASGTATMPIVFTSVRDSAGGNTGGAASASYYDWTGISLGASGSTFDHCAFYYAGASDNAALAVNANSVTVTNSIFAHDHGPTDRLPPAPALDASQATAMTTITGNIFYDNLLPLSISQNVSLDDTNLFDNSAADPTNPLPNKYNGIDYVGAGCCNCSNTIMSNISWYASKVPFIIGSPSSAPNLCVQSGGVLTLGPNVTMKFFTGGSLQAVSTATLTTGKGDVFTSIKDDASGGDTNGDGSATMPMSADWNGASFAETGATIDHCSFYYAGGSDNAALLLGSGQTTVTNSIFAHNKGPTVNLYAAPALDAHAASSAAISNNIFYDNLFPLRIGVNVSVGDTNLFDNGASAPMDPKPNVYNAIDVEATTCCNCGNVVIGNLSWTTTKVPFLIGDPKTTLLCIAPGGQLMLGNNVTMKFFNAGKLDVSSPTSTLMTGTGDIFTSYKDDAHGGDTDNSMMTSVPAAGDWSGLVENGVCQTWPNILYYTTNCP